MRYEQSLRVDFRPRSFPPAAPRSPTHVCVTHPPSRNTRQGTDEAFTGQSRDRRRAVRIARATEPTAAAVRHNWVTSDV